jgi:hypothetical protein
MAAYGLTADDLKMSGSPRSSSRAATKFRGPEGQSWSGLGRRPKWVLDLLASGQDLSQFQSDECGHARLRHGLRVQMADLSSNMAPESPSKPNVTCRNSAWFMALKWLIP